MIKVSLELTHGPPASSSQGLGWQVWTITPSLLSPLNLGKTRIAYIFTTYVYICVWHVWSHATIAWECNASCVFLSPIGVLNSLKQGNKHVWQTFKEESTFTDSLVCTICIAEGLNDTGSILSFLLESVPCSCLVQSRTRVNFWSKHKKLAVFTSCSRVTSSWNPATMA